LPISPFIRRSRAGGWSRSCSSSAAGLVIDSVVFLWLASGSLEYLPAQIIDKAWMVLLSLPLVAFLRRRDELLGLTAA
jgi:queuosine precursor transporter